MFESVNIMTIKAKQADYGIQVILKGLSVQFYVTLGIHAKIVSIVRFTMIGGIIVNRTMLLKLCQIK